MAKEHLNELQIKDRIDTLNNWLLKNPNHLMYGTGKKESLYYIELLTQLEWQGLEKIVNKCPTQIFQQLGVTL